MFKLTNITRGWITADLTQILPTEKCQYGSCMTVDKIELSNEQFNEPQR